MRTNRWPMIGYVLCIPCSPLLGRERSSIISSPTISVLAFYLLCIRTTFVEQQTIHIHNSTISQFLYQPPQWSQTTKQQGKLDETSIPSTISGTDCFPSFAARSGTISFYPSATKAVLIIYQQHLPIQLQSHIHNLKWTSYSEPWGVPTSRSKWPSSPSGLPLDRSSRTFRQRKNPRASRTCQGSWSIWRYDQYTRWLSQMITFGFQNSRLPTISPISLWSICWAQLARRHKPLLVSRRSVVKRGLQIPREILEDSRSNSTQMRETGIGFMYVYTAPFVRNFQDTLLTWMIEQHTSLLPTRPNKVPPLHSRKFYFRAILFQIEPHKRQNQVLTWSVSDTKAKPTNKSQRCNHVLGLSFHSPWSHPPSYAPLQRSRNSILLQTYEW